MATAVVRIPATRRRHQELVASPLERIEERRRRVYALRAGGARPAALRDLKADLRSLRRELSAVVGCNLPADMSNTKPTILE